MSPKSRTSTCTHVDMVLLSWEEIKAKKPKCQDCGKLCKGACWLCLFQDCDYVGCGSKQADHSSRHQAEEGHPLCINLHNKRFWCSKCNTEVFEHGNTPPFVLRKFAAGFEAPPQKPTHRGRLATTENSFEEDAEPETLGLTGLRNLGNTCYMNAALQALSHCRQLTRFFLDCPGLARPGRFAARNLGTPLSTAYAGLLAELWSPRRHAAVTPHLVLQSIRLAHPAFRSWAQQDAQEFLRCFMDQLHEELQRPVLLPPVGEEDDAAGCGGVDGDDGRGGNSGVGGNDACDNGGTTSADGSDAATGSTAANSATMGASASAHSLVPSADTGSTSAVGSGGGGGGGGGNGGVADDSNGGDQGSAGTSEGAVKRRRIRRFRSIISDTFNGSLVSTVQCNTCERLSSTLEVFQDLSLPIPVAEQLAARQRKSAVGGGSSGVWWLASFVTWPLSWLRSYLVWTRVSLQDCLDAFFSNDDLKGDNMYHCAKCGKLRNGIKYSRISRLPDMLTVHLKRFRHDFAYSSKIHSHVAFPVEGLDMKPYLHRDCRAAQTVYDLTAIVCHHGSTSGGHYTAFGLNHASLQWYEFDDARVRPVDVSAVEGAQAYVLFYRKRDEWIQPLRLKVSEIMETDEDSSSLMPFYISRPWINKFNTFGDPGPISNEDFLCPHRLLSPHAADLPEDAVMRVPYQAWDLLMTEFGGGPTVNRLGPCPECAGELERTRERARLELGIIRKELQQFQRAARLGGASYCISMRWFRRWESFATERQLEPPGPIDNSGIVLRRGARLMLRASSDYAQVSGRAWRYLLAIYGGGPEVKIEGSSYQPKRRNSSSRSSSSSGSGNDDSRSGSESDSGQVGAVVKSDAAALDADKD